MQRRTNFDRVEKAARRLPRVTVSTMYGAPALKLDGQLLACIATNKAAEPNTLVVRVDFFERDFRISSEPDVFYIKAHYVSYPCVLARLARIRDATLRELLESAWEHVSATMKRKATRRRRRT